MSMTENTELTKESIQEALFELMRQKDYEAITMTEVAKKSGFGRATLYRYYQSKEEIITGYFERNSYLFGDIAKVKAHGEDDYYEIIFRVFTALKDNKDMVKLIMKARLELMYLDFLNKGMIQNFESNKYVEDEYTPYYFAGSLFNVSMQWVRNDCKDSVKHISDIYFNSLFKPKEGTL